MTSFWNCLGRQGRALAVWRQRQKIRRLFRREVGFDGDSENPKTHWEKVQYRKLYGNHEFYGRQADKLLVRDYVRERVGEEVLVPLFGVHDRLDETILDGSPSSFMIKVSNASGLNEVVRNKEKMDYRRTIRYFNRMLEIARELSRGIDFVQGDLYNVCGKIFFGEMTFTTSAGFKVNHNPALNELRDTMWELDRDNPMFYRDPVAVRTGR